MRRKLGHIVFASLGLALLIAIGCTAGSDDVSQAPAKDGDSQSETGRSDQPPSTMGNDQGGATNQSEPIVKEDPSKLAGFFDPLPESSAGGNDSDQSTSVANSDGTSTQLDDLEGDGGTDAGAGNVTNQAATGSADAETHQEEAANAIKTNGPIFENWPKPKLAIVFSGRQNGYFEPCGCAGLENMKGGTARRATMLAQRREAGWPILAVDLGNVVRRFGKQAEIKSTITLDALVGMGYDALGFGPNDLAMPLDHILSVVADDTRPFVSANVKIPYLEVPKYRVVERGGLKIGITAVLGDAEAKSINQEEIMIAPAAEALAEPYQALLEEQCDILLLLAYADTGETEELAKRYPKFTFASTAGGPVEPPYLPRENKDVIPTIVEVGEKGMFVNVVGLFDEAAVPVRYQRVPIDARFADEPRMHQLLVEMQNQYQQLGWAGLDLRPVAHESGQSFVGSKTCGECHTRAFRIFKDTGHAHATDTLVHLEPPRQFDPECVSCHVTGWEPQKYFPFGGGFTSLDDTAHLGGNGCENCHGPGSDHVQAEDNPDADPEMRLSLRKLMRVTLEEAKQNTCLKCHDLDNSPDYIKQGFDAYWPAVEHYGRH
ncbi:MAG: hypothetical protein MPJ50_11505 [Pirellulales bacterium]|nr:hypothetical protein [Pirellulales bacterium]